jgi:hypothetical protein
MLSTLVLFGPTGDLPGREPWDDERFRRLAADRLERHAGDVPAAARRPWPGSSVGRSRWPPTWRWSGTRFHLRTGKALARDHMEVVLRLQARHQRETASRSVVWLRVRGRRSRG